MAEAPLIRQLGIAPSQKADATLKQLEDAASTAERNYRGWPVLWLYWSREHLTKTKDALVFDMATGDNPKPGIYRWIFRRDGVLVQTRETSETRFEDRERFDPVLKILEFAEDFATYPEMYRLLGLPENASIRLHYRWLNAKGRYVAYHGNPISYEIAKQDQRMVPFDDPEIEVELPLSLTPEGAIPYAASAVQSLIDHLGIDFKIDEAVAKDWARKVVTRTLR